MQIYYVYILSNYTNSTLYIGVTNDLKRRIYEHKNKLISGFSSKYNVNKLVYFEETTDIKSAIQRE
ncbi:MAG: GIY-YIG nuclease family protein, partial [Treponema sp.]|nr:GIY-YIG nuclease family protein [Treponema sp.]